MRVGTDGVLLGAWCPLLPDDPKAERAVACSVFRVLDAGTGCGLIALMVAQRIEEAVGATAVLRGYADRQVDAIDIDAPSVEQAAENFASSPWSGHLRAYRSDVRDWDGTYNLIVTNPPFFTGSLASPNLRRAQARQAGLTLSFEELALSAARLLAPSGILGLIVPSYEEAAMVGSADRNGLYLQARCVVCSKPEGPPKRVLMAFGKDTCPLQETSLVLYDADNARSQAYARLTERFYL